MKEPVIKKEYIASPLERFPDVLLRLAEDKRSLKEYGSGETIIGNGQDDERVRFIITGQASLVLRDDDGGKISVESLGPGDIFGEIGFFTGVPWRSDSELVADEPCRVLEISLAEFQETLREQPYFVENLVKNLVRKIMLLDRSLLKSKMKRRALQALISRQDHIFPDYVIGEYVRKRLEKSVHELAQSDGPVLIIGEPGVGKEVIAHTVFRKSYHYKEVFLLLDLLNQGNVKPLGTQLPQDDRADNDPTDEQLVLLFGCEEVSKDGTLRETPGYFELTDGGTLLVRGVDQLTPVVQMKLLEAMVTESFQRFRGTGGNKASVRLIATTRLNPSEITFESHPLVFSLMQRSITIPPLRSRRREIPELVKHYAAKYGRELGREPEEFPNETLSTLVNYRWPGNDLELSSTLKRAMLISEGGVPKPRDIYFDLKRVGRQFKIDLLRFRIVKRIFRSPLFPAVLQSAATPLFLIILAFLFLGPSDPMQNPAALFSWAVGWTTLILGAFLFARSWCSICPIGTVGGLAQKVVSLGKPFPAFLKNHSDFLIAGAVLFVIWFETATGIRGSPFNLGLLLVVMMVSAIVISVLYERQAWCLYLCGLGGMVSVLSKASILELRADRNVCISRCGSNECLLGSESKGGCPFGQAGPRLHSNRLCRVCGTCVKNCPHEAITLNLRIPGQEIWEISRTNTGTAFLVVGMLGGLLSEMVAKIPAYDSLVGSLPLPEPARFSLCFLAILVGVNLLLALSALISCRVSADSFQRNYSRYGLALLPLVLSAFMAYHLYYFINLGVQLPILISQYFDFELLRSLVIVVPSGITQLVQKIVLWGGLAWTLVTIFLVGRGSAHGGSRNFSGMLPHAVLAVMLAIVVDYTLSQFFSL
jgi:transcriptional regulator with AAA-type ATPase domain/polyferredoxin